FLQKERSRLIAFESFFFAASLPRLLSTAFRRPDFRGRDHIRRTVGQLFYIGRLVARDWRNRRDRNVTPVVQTVAPSAARPTLPGGVASSAPAADAPTIVGRRSGGKIAAVGRWSGRTPAGADSRPLVSGPSSQTSGLRAQSRSTYPRIPRCRSG